MTLNRLQMPFRRIKAKIPVPLGLYWRHLPDWIDWQRQRHHITTHDQSITSNSQPARLSIVFVSVYPRAREFKLAYAARLCGHQVTLVTNNIWSQSIPAQYFVSHYAAENPWQILTLLDKLRPDVTHLFAHMNNTRMLPVLLHAPSPVVYDPYDCLGGMIHPEYQYPDIELRAERTCFAQADHICARSLEPRYLRRHFSYQMAPTTYFPEYCWCPPRQHQRRQIRDDDELHVVYSGGLWPEDRYPSSTHGYAQYMEVARALSRQRIHLHIYPANASLNCGFEEFFHLYVEESKRNPFLHMHRPLPYEHLMRALPQYDAAMHIMGVTVNNELGRVTRAKQDYSAANKLFDYIEAGLPVIIHNGRHQRGIVRHYGLSVEVSNIEVVREELVRVLSREWQVQNSAAITAHIERLDHMYQTVVKE